MISHWVPKQRSAFVCSANLVRPYIKKYELHEIECDLRGSIPTANQYTLWFEKKGGSTFVIITLENVDRFLFFYRIKQEKNYKYTREKVCISSK